MPGTAVNAAIASAASSEQRWSRSSPSATALAAPTTWEIDPMHTTSSFSVRHMMVSNVSGAFGKTTGTVTLEGKDWKTAVVKATIDASTIDTRNSKRDEHLKSADFFDVAKFPTITFKSTKVEAAAGGGYRMSLFYPPEERVFRGKTAEREDRVEVRFIELTPPRRIVEAVRFVSDDPAFLGEMTITVTFEEVAGGTEVAFLFANLPPGLRPEDNEAGTRLSLEQLARRFA